MVEFFTCLSGVGATDTGSGEITFQNFTKKWMLLINKGGLFFNQRRSLHILIRTRERNKAIFTKISCFLNYKMRYNRESLQ